MVIWWSRSLWPTVSMKLAPLLRFVASSWASMPSFTDGDDRISVRVKIHWEEAERDGGRVGVCGECAI